MTQLKLDEIPDFIRSHPLTVRGSTLPQRGRRESAVSLVLLVTGEDRKICQISYLYDPGGLKTRDFHWSYQFWTPPEPPLPVRIMWPMHQHWLTASNVVLTEDDGDTVQRIPDSELLVDFARLEVLIHSKLATLNRLHHDWAPLAVAEDRLHGLIRRLNRKPRRPNPVRSGATT